MGSSSSSVSVTATVALLPRKRSTGESLATESVTVVLRPSLSMLSSTPLTVTVWLLFEVVKVSVAGDTVATPVSPLATATATASGGGQFKLTPKVAVAPSTTGTEVGSGTIAITVVRPDALGDQGPSPSAFPARACIWYSVSSSPSSSSSGTARVLVSVDLDESSASVHFVGSFAGHSAALPAHQRKS